MSKLNYKYISYLSIDVAIGAVVSSAFISKMLNVEINEATLLTLGLVVWCIYTFDHLMDAKKGNEEVLLPRHAFHLVHFKLLTKLLICILLSVGVLLFSLPLKIIAIGAFLGLGVIAYFISIRFLNWEHIYHKELTVAFIYFSGILIGPLGSENLVIELNHYIYLSGYFILILLNLLIFSYHDQQADVLNDFPSILRVVDKSKTRNWIYLLMVIFIVVSVYSILVIPNLEGVLLISMFGILCFLQFMSNSKLRNLNYRYLGDGIFILPIIYLI